MDQWELFDLESKDSETVDLFNQPDMQDVVSRLKGELAQLRRELADEVE